MLDSLYLKQPTGTVPLQIPTVLHSTASLPHALSASVQDYGNEAMAPDKKCPRISAREVCDLRGM